MSLFSALLGSTTRFRALWLSIAVFLVISTLTRIALLFINLGDVGDAWTRILPGLVIGFVLDLFVGLAITIPFGLYLLCVSTRWLRSAVGRWFHLVILAFFVFGLLYLAVVELFFFGEFAARFNYVAVDYLIFPHEVFVNLWDTYPVFEVLIGALVVALVAALLLRTKWWKVLALDSPRSKRFAPVIAQICLVALGVCTLSTNTMKVSPNRVLNEIAGNGYFTFGWAAYSNELDYDLYYVGRPQSESIRRMRASVTLPGDSLLDPPESLSIARRIFPIGPARPYNIVLVLEESFGSHFVGSLNPAGPNCTPQFDTLAKHGLFFTHIYATGNRTVRGIEASLLSFPPIPGNSIVRRPGGEHVFSLPQLLKDKGYQTVFIYGGRSYFDNLGQFASTNGFERVIDQTDFQNVTFSTIWGVCDEDLFSGSVAFLDTLHTSGRPFFATLLTVSNHSPYTYPTGRIAADPKDQRRENAVQYADYCIGKFVRDARSHDWFDSTIFVFLGDHGARVYGSQAIPMESYKIPILIYCPSLVPIGQPVDLLGSQFDLAPTILGLLNIEYNSGFFGRDLRRVTKDRSWALMSHNRDVSLLRNDTLAVLGMGKSVELWKCGPEGGEITRIESALDSSIAWDAVAYYQTAYELYKQRKLHPLPQTPIVTSPRDSRLTIPR